MIRALGEIEVLARKAARGAGMSWGMAEEAGFAVRWLEARGLPGAALLAVLLNATDGADRAALTLVPANAWRADLPACPIAAGTALADRAAMLAGRSLTLGPIRSPLLILPFLAETGAARLAWPGCRISADADGIAAEGDVAADTAVDALCTLPAAPGASPPATQVRADVAEDVLAALEAFAHRTYAPATEASRLAGAGAGLTDND